jgi:hypothetical protein
MCYSNMQFSVMYHGILNLYLRCKLEHLVLEYLHVVNIHLRSPVESWPAVIGPRRPLPSLPPGRRPHRRRMVCATRTAHLQRRPHRPAVDALAAACTLNQDGDGASERSILRGKEGGRKDSREGGAIAFESAMATSSLFLASSAESTRSFSLICNFVRTLGTLSAVRIISTVEYLDVELAENAAESVQLRDLGLDLAVEPVKVISQHVQLRHCPHMLGPS